MKHNNNLFQEFEAVTTEKWISAIEKTLKDKTINSLNWVIEEGLEISPIQRADNTVSQYIGSTSSTTTNNWSICEEITVPFANNSTSLDYVLANKNILHLLNNGSNALIIDFPKTPNSSELDLLLQGIHLDLVPIHFKGEALSKDPMAVLQAIAQTKEHQQIKGSCDFGNPTEDIMMSCLNYCLSNLPNLRLINISIPSISTMALSNAIFVASQWFDKLLADGKTLEQISSLLRFEFHIGDYFFVELSTIRAFKKMWFGLLEAYGASTILNPYLHASTQSAQNENQYWNMITATTQTMAAAIAGVDSILVCPCNGQKNADEFTRRIARNVQHLLQSESYLDRVIDPSAGAYYIENLTAAIAQKSWQQFCHL